MYRAYSRDHPQSLLEPLMPTQPRQERCQVQSQHLMGSSSEKYAALVKTRPQVMISLIIITQWPRLSHHRAHFHFSWDLVTAEEMMGSVSWFLLWIMTGNNLCCVHPLCDKIWRIMVIRWKQSKVYNRYKRKFFSPQEKIRFLVSSFGSHCLTQCYNFPGDKNFQICVLGNVLNLF